MKVIESWNIPKYLNVKRAMVIIEDGHITLEVGGDGFTVSLGSKKLEK